MKSKTVKPPPKWKAIRVTLITHSMEPKWKDGETVEFRRVSDFKKLAIGKDYYISTKGQAETFATLDRIEGELLIFRWINCKNSPGEFRAHLNRVASIAQAVGLFHTIPGDIARGIYPRRERLKVRSIFSEPNPQSAD